MDLKLDDLLEKVNIPSIFTSHYVNSTNTFNCSIIQQQDNVVSLDLEYVQLDVSKILQLLNKTFAKRKM